MPRTINRDEDWKEDGDDSEWTSDDDESESSEWQEEEDGDDTIPCPHCGKPVYEDAEQCPQCGNYLSQEDAPRQIKPLWIIVGTVLCLAMVLMWIWIG